MAFSQYLNFIQSLQYDDLGISANTDTSVRQRGEPGQTPVPIPPLKQTNSMTKNTRKKHDYIFEIEQVFLFLFLFSKLMKFSGHIISFREVFFIIDVLYLLFAKRKILKKKRPGLHYSRFTQLTYLICGHS